MRGPRREPGSSLWLSADSAHSLPEAFRGPAVTSRDRGDFGGVTAFSLKEEPLLCCSTVRSSSRGVPKKPLARRGGAATRRSQPGLTCLNP